MIRRIALLAAGVIFAMNAAGQGSSRFEEVIDVDVRDGRIILPVTVGGVPHEFILDPARASSSVFGSAAGTLERLGVGENLFIQSLAVSSIDDNEQEVSGVLGADVFRGHILTIDKEGRTITLSSPYKPDYMALRNRATMLSGTTDGRQTVSLDGKTITAPLDSLLRVGVLTLDFTKLRTYFEPYATFVRPERVAAQPEAKPLVTEGEVVHLDRDAFLRDVFNFRQYSEWKFQGDMPAVIDFWATWCGPCLRLSPVIAELAEEYEGRVRFYKVNVDEEKEIAAGFFDVNAIPLLVFIPMEGEPVKMMGTSKEEIREKIETLLLGR